MALKNCEHCGNLISDKAYMCPKCGIHVTPTNLSNKTSPIKPENKNVEAIPVNHNSSKSLGIDITQHKKDSCKSNNTGNTTNLKIILLLIIILGAGAIIWQSIQLHELRNFDSDSDVIALREEIQQLLEEAAADREEEGAEPIVIEANCDSISAAPYKE